ncbi:MAG: AAA family ATPase, partial [Calditrichaeota bacterium]|nr:AAA family ATPase [Calditrichota bacterium]
MNLFSKFSKGLEKTRSGLLGSVGKLLKGRSVVSDEELEEIEELLIAGDVGPELTEVLLERLRRADSSSGDLLDVLRQEVEGLLAGAQQQTTRPEGQRPHVIMVVGVNGSGKTTTIGKLAARYTSQGKKVLLAAADTFRAAAGDQLEIWAERAGAQIVRSKPGADPAAVAYDAVQAGQARDVDIVIIDTAGRLHTKKNLMEELRKVHRVIDKA